MELHGRTPLSDTRLGVMIQHLETIKALPPPPIIVSHLSSPHVAPPPPPPLAAAAAALMRPTVERARVYLPKMGNGEVAAVRGPYGFRRWCNGRLYDGAFSMPMITADERMAPMGDLWFPFMVDDSAEQVVLTSLTQPLSAASRQRATTHASEETSAFSLSRGPAIIQSPDGAEVMVSEGVPFLCSECPPLSGEQFLMAALQRSEPELLRIQAEGVARSEPEMLRRHGEGVAVRQPVSVSPFVFVCRYASIC
ncbi:hypothetical protein PAPYR_5160 [Paratrimastix pyriformis]|uniref:Uncharacterized protein n=1 Tax=Paratrimastix pyriformis TaxID=342808 RepID=A0ABQ8UQA3_9EUKA|nr:hypothetical protein PAPYR_5160 [Paratrimastix pyriformis]